MTQPKHTPLPKLPKLDESTLTYLAEAINKASDEDVKWYLNRHCTFEYRTAIESRCLEKIYGWLYLYRDKCNEYEVLLNEVSDKAQKEHDKAVNNHDKLVEALKYALNIINDLPTEREEHSFHREIPWMEAALKEAEGGEG